MQLRQVTNDFAAAPQIAPDDPAAAKAAGFAMIVCNRPDGEDDGQPPAGAIAAAAEDAGIAFRHIPVAGGMPAEAIDGMAAALAAANGPVLAYCRTGTRSTLLWALVQASRGGAPDDIAAAAAGAGYDVTPVRGLMETLSRA